MQRQRTSPYSGGYSGQGGYRSDLMDVEVIFQHQTEKAFCLRETETSADIWIPKSICEMHSKQGGALTRGRVAILTTSETILRDRGLI